MRRVVDGESFEVVEACPGQYSLTWVSGPNPGYGFHTASNTGAAMDVAALDSAIRQFLDQVDPVTGYIE